MAKKKDSNIDIENAEVKDIERTEETESAAAKVQEASTSDKEINKKYKLANPNTSYQEEGFTLVADQEKELPENPSQQLIERIRHGFIVEV
jgi:hypothetical protein